MSLNLTYYVGNDLYSDGDIETEMLDIVKSEKNLDDVIENDNRWPILYHFSKIRHNILNWYSFKKESTLLEIGSGCGALTELFCKNCSFVTSIDLSKKRSEINYLRNKKYSNLELIVGNLIDIDFNQKFDYITLIGVLEYVKSFNDSNNPYVSFLKKIKSLLKSDGKLLIAIENKFGLKYWAGAKEDHTGRLFDSIEGYPSNKTVETFGKYEIETLLESVGFNRLYFYYPYPDYKMPSIVFSDEHLPGNDTFLNNPPFFDQDRYQFFDERLALKQIIHNKLFPIFSNSFLIEAGIL